MFGLQTGHLSAVFKLPYLNVKHKCGFDNKTKCKADVTWMYENLELFNQIQSESM